MSENPDASFQESQTNEPELNSNGMTVIGIYVLVLTAVFFVSVGALIPYFKWEADRTLDAKVNTQVNPTFEAMRVKQDEAMQGKGNGAAISIDEAMRRTVTDLSRNK